MTIQESGTSSYHWTRSPSTRSLNRLLRFAVAPIVGERIGERDVPRRMRQNGLAALPGDAAKPQKRLFEQAEISLGRLITQRSQVQILPPLPCCSRSEVVPCKDEEPPLVVFRHFPAEMVGSEWQHPERIGSPSTNRTGTSSSIEPTRRHRARLITGPKMRDSASAIFV